MKPEARKNTLRRRSTAGERSDFLGPNGSSGPTPAITAGLVSDIAEMHTSNIKDE